MIAFDELHEMFLNHGDKAADMMASYIVEENDADAVTSLTEMIDLDLGKQSLAALSCLVEISDLSPKMIEPHVAFLISLLSDHDKKDTSEQAKLISKKYLASRMELIETEVRLAKLLSNLE